MSQVNVVFEEQCEKLETKYCLKILLYHLRGWVARGDRMFLGRSDLYNLPGQTSCQVQLKVGNKLLLISSKSRFQFEESVSTFTAGLYSLEEGSTVPALVYVTFSGTIQVKSCRM